MSVQQTIHHRDTETQRKNLREVQPERHGYYLSFSVSLCLCGGEVL
jgi:hypothetical protein